MARSPDPKPCELEDHIPLSGHEGYISGQVALDKGWGSLECPWKIQGVPGQTITVSIIDFNPSEESKTCQTLG